MLKILFFCLFALPVFCELSAQINVKKLDLKKISKSQLLHILKSKSNYVYEESRWTFYSADTTFYSKDTLMFVNNFEYFTPTRDCYKTSLWFVDLRKNYININIGAYLCKEPPTGGTTTFHLLATDIKKNKLFVKIWNSSIKQKFEVMSIETVETKSKEKPYRITLIRCNYD